MTKRNYSCAPLNAVNNQRFAWLIISIVALMFAVTFPSQSASAQSTISSNQNNNGYTITLFAPSSVPQQNNPATNTDNTSGSQQVYPVVLPTLTTDTALFANTPCVAEYVRYYTNKAQAGVSDALTPQIWYTLNRHYAPCIYRTQPSSNTPPSISPSQQTIIRQSILRQLPSPTPQFDPTFGVTGIKSYLSVNTPLLDSITTQSALGLLHAQSSGTITISFGDNQGNLGPTTDLGGPWPTGDITHIYHSPGCYVVTITETWTVKYNVGAENGELFGLQTQGTIANYCIYLAGGELIR